MDIWTILEYTAYVTVIGLLIGLIKMIFHDKLDARWHYFIWLVLLVRILVPVGVRPIPAPLSVFDQIPIGRWVEMGRILARTRGQEGLFELLWQVYLWGAAILGSFYLALWVILRVQVARAAKAEEDVREYVDRIAAKYRLKSCGDIRVRKTGTPYICGLLRPVLVLPEGEVPEEPVIVHELLHKKYQDVLVNLGIHGVRVVNWFNPIVWILTSAALNDSEALCDQRVLECWGRENAKRYGELLISLGEGGRSMIQVGTSNMASSYRNMRTRIRRIGDFRRVPEKIGLVTLCITLMLAVAAIGSEAQEPGILEIPQIETLEDLERALLYARCYHARTPEEAIYLFLRSCEENSTIYRMAVMPEEEIPRYEEFSRKWFLNTGLITWADLSSGEDAYPWYFPRQTAWMEDYLVYNLLYDENTGSATVCAVPNAKRDQVFVERKLTLTKEDGWKVWLVEESQEQQGEYNPVPLLAGSVRLGDFLVDLSAYNEGHFDQLGAARAGGMFYSSKEGREKKSYPSWFSVEYKYRSMYVTYLGEESLEGRIIKIVAADKVGQDMDQRQEQPWVMAGTPSPTAEGRTVSSAGYSDSDGNGGAVFDGAELMTGEPRLVFGVGDGFSEPGYGWQEDDRIVSYVRIYVDDVLVAEGKVEGE